MFSKLKSKGDNIASVIVCKKIETASGQTFVNRFHITVTARVWCRGGIDRKKKKNSTTNLTSVNGACF